MVAVTPTSFYVRPNFPFNLMFLPEIYGLEYSVPRKSIRSVVTKDGFLGKSVRIELDTESGGSVAIDLWLRRRDEFLKALASS